MSNPARAREYLRIAVEALGRYKLRTSLSVVGVVCGVAAVIAMMSVSQGAAREALAQVDALGLDNVVARSRGSSASPGAWRGLVADDADRAAALVPGVIAGSPLIDRYLRIARGERSVMARVLGVRPAAQTILRLSVDRGRFLSVREEQAAVRACVLGASLSLRLFGYADPLGERVRIGQDYYQVVGVLRAHGSDPRSGSTLAWHDIDNLVFAPLAALSGRTLPIAPEQPVDEIWLQVQDGRRSEELAKVFERALTSRNRSGREFDMIVPRELLAQRWRTQRTFSIVVGSIAILALLVGGIGIMNVMLASVVERTHEIGVRRTVGATRRHVAVQFLVEALLMTLSGGTLGILVGAAVSWGITAFAGWSTDVSLSGVALGFFVSFLVGLVFGSYPAMRAAALQPVDALRYE